MLEAVLKTVTKCRTDIDATALNPFFLDLNKPGFSLNMERAKLHHF